MLPLRTSSLDLGADVPMPTFTVAAAPFIPATLPSTRLLLCETRAREPIAVALVMTELAGLNPGPMRVLKPTKVFSFPLELLSPALAPRKVFRPPIVFAEPEPYPRKVLRLPVVLLTPAL